MNIMDFVPAFRKPIAEAVAASAEETNDTRRHYPKSTGPVKTRSVTNGQIRRHEARWHATQKRKATSRNRRNFMRNEQRIAVLRGHVQAVSHGVDSPQYRGIIDQVVASYGDRSVPYGHASPTHEAQAVESMLGRWEAIVAERPDVDFARV